MLSIENLGMLNDGELEAYSEFNIKTIENVEATSPVWSNVLKTVLAAGSIAACFL